MRYNQTGISSTLTAGELQKQSITALKSLADSRGYSVTKIRKAEIINEILAQEMR